MQPIFYNGYILKFKTTDDSGQGITLLEVYSNVKSDCVNLRGWLRFIAYLKSEKN